MPVAGIFLSVEADGKDSLCVVSGVVTSSEDGLPLIGAAVVYGSSEGVVTDIDGRYTIEVPAGAELSCQCLGFQPVIFTVPDGVIEWKNDIVMVSDAQALDESVVIAYGVRKKGTIAGSVSTVKGEKLNTVPAASFDQALQGASPGMSVMSSSGEPSKSAYIRIRGVNSINSDTEPLFILDGMPISSSDFSSISPADIESISVLKDASATSIYGSRAANGVVVITSKRGTSEIRPVIKFRTQQGFSALSQDKWEMMNTAERIQYEQEIGINEGVNYEMLARTDIDWRKVVFSDFAPLNTYELSVSGAGNIVNYYVSGSYYRQKGIALSSDFARYNVRANVEVSAASWMKVGMNTTMGYEDIMQAVEGAFYTNAPVTAARMMLPYWNPYKEDGSVASIKDGSWTGIDQNPIEWDMNNPASTKRFKLLSSMYAEFRPLKGLVLRTMGGVDFSNAPYKALSYPSYSANNGIGAVSKSNTNAFNLTWTNTANYQFDIDGMHSFNFLLGHEMVSNQAEGLSLTTRGQAHDKLMNISAGTAAISWADNYVSSSYLSFFGRGEYNYANRYYADFSVRGDASSKFGKSSRWAAFWSIGLMWNLRNEEFMKNRAGWLTTAQVAFSTGTSGNSSIPEYDHLPLFVAGPEYGGYPGIAPLSRGNEDLTWEQLWSTNLAFHLGFLNRINVDVELYNKLTTNMLMEVPVSYSTGFSTKWDNVGAMLNRGAELSVNADILRIKEFRWNVSANVSYNKNRITELYNGQDEYDLASAGLYLKVGHPYGEFYLNRYAGVNPANGDALWYDKDGNIVDEIRDEDKVLIGKTYFAPWEGGFGTTLSWKGLTLNANFTWVADRWMLNHDRWFTESNGNFSSYNQSKRLLYERWKQPGDITEIPRHGEITYDDTHLLEDASFLRLKNLSLTYSLPAEWMRKSRLFQGITIGLQAQNLLTFTKFTGSDPESYLNVYQATYPLSRQYTMSLDFIF